MDRPDIQDQAQKKGLQVQGDVFAQTAGAAQSREEGRDAARPFGRIGQEAHDQDEHEETARRIRGRGGDFGQVKRTGDPDQYSDGEEGLRDSVHPVEIGQETQACRDLPEQERNIGPGDPQPEQDDDCLLYTSDAADE